MPATMRAPPPFDSKDANLVLVSSDGVEFRVHKHMIALASPVLAALIPASSTSLAPPHPYVHPRQPRQRPRLLLSQPAHVLNIFLRFIYPIPEPPSLSLPTISLLLSLAHDYSATSITTRMRPHLLSAIHLDNSPLAVYALASSAGMADVARLAARRALAHPLPPARELTGSAFGLAGDTLLRLLAYRRACAAAAAEVASTRAGVPWWIQLRWRSFCFLSECWACPRGARRTLKWKKVVGESVEVPVWWVEYLNEVRMALLGEKLDPAVAQDRAIMRRAVEGAAGCERCKERVFWDMVEFARILEDAIEEAISSVSFLAVSCSIIPTDVY